MDRRIPFEEAVSEKSLLKTRFEGLSLPQQTALKIINGSPLSGEELEIWNAFQEVVDYDQDGFPTQYYSTLPYTPKDYREAWVVVGRRGSKSDAIAATQVAYEALCGGHEDFVRKGQRALCFQVAQDLRMARYSLHFISAALESSPIGKASIMQVTADRVDLKNGLTICTVPPTLKSVRGYACPVAVLDEVGVWYQDSDAANPDYEIYRALSPGQLQFPNRKLIGISTPWNKSGLLYKFYSAGTQGAKLSAGIPREEYKDVVVLHGSTALLQNPLVSREYLAKERAHDPKAFERECLAVFQDSISGFLPSALVERATDRGIFERVPESRPAYVCAIDPAFKRDAFGLTILHRDDDGNIVVDAVRRWMGSAERPLNPRDVLEEIAQLVKNYRVDVLYSDQYHFESLAQLAGDYGMSILGIPFTARSKSEMYGNLQQLFHQGRIRLIEHEELLKELRTLERTLTDGGTVQIGAPNGMHDDVVTTLTIAASQAMALEPSKLPEKPKEPTVAEQCWAQIQRKAGHREAASAWD